MFKISQEYLKEILDYDPDSGLFVWKRDSANNQIKIGDVAGHSSNMGANTPYVLIGIDGRIYRAHRLAFLYIFGFIPKVIDHLDRDGTNNRWKNLRAANKISNAQNSKKRVDQEARICWS